MKSNAYKVHSKKDLEEVREGTERRRRGMEVSEWLHLGCHGRSRRQELGHRLEGQRAMCVRLAWVSTQPPFTNLREPAGPHPMG